MLNELLKERDLLPVLKMDNGVSVTRENWRERREEMKKALETYSYGVTPPIPEWVTGKILTEDTNAYAGKVIQQRVELSFPSPGGIFRFPFVLFVPKRFPNAPVMLHLAFRTDLPDRYVPIEEITDNGFALAVVCYTDIVNDGHFGDFSDGLALMFDTDCNREKTAWGKIGMWAYGASRILDYLLTREDIDAKHTAVIGHSRLGKTSLWTAAQDERFWCAISNDSGYGGAATSKHGHGERVRDFLRAGSWEWYCENFKDYTDDREDRKPYDQAYLLAMIAPRYLCVGSAEEDRGADPESEFLTSLWASQAWELLGTPGLITPDKLPQAGDVLGNGTIQYHMRSGGHFLSREDWGNYMRFLNKKLGR